MVVRHSDLIGLSSVSVVVADGFEHEAERIEPEGGEVVGPVLREVARLVQDRRTQPRHELVGHAHSTSRAHDEGEVLQPRTASRV